MSLRLDKEEYVNFRGKLCNLLNIYSIDNTCNTPDYVLAEYIIDNLKVYAGTMRLVKCIHDDKEEVLNDKEKNS